LTYIQTKEGWLYLTVIIDLFDRKGVGWSFNSAMTAQETVIPAWRMACRNRPFQKDLIFHPDIGVQYVCKAFKNLLKSNLITQSISRKGNCWDNTVTESFFKTLKVERVYQMDLFRYIEGWYNTRRI
jgi:putative transposase